MYRKAVATNRDVEERARIERADNERALGAIADIQDSLNAIARESSPMRVRAEGREPLSGTMEQRKREALARIAALDERIRHDKARLQELEAGLRKGGIRDAGLQRTIGALKQSVAREEGMVARLNDQVRVMATKVATLETEVQQNNETIRARETTIEEKRRELATVYYVIGTKQELIRAGVVVSDGGVLGLGRSLQVSSHLSETGFTLLDTDRESAIRIPAKKAIVLSAQPAGSYALSSSGDHLTLVITDPREFRKAKHVVIRVD